MSEEKCALKIVVSKFQILQNLLLLAVIIFAVITIEFVDIALTILTSFCISSPLFKLASCVLVFSKVSISFKVGSGSP